MLNIEQTAKAPEDRLCMELSPVVAMIASEHKPWFEVCRAAMLELDSERLPERIVAAKEAVQLRLKEIQGDTDHQAERQQMEDALSSLRTLEREQNWRNLAAAASAETDSEKLVKIVEELCSALDKRQGRTPGP